MRISSTGRIPYRTSRISGNGRSWIMSLRLISEHEGAPGDLVPVRAFGTNLLKGHAGELQLEPGTVVVMMVDLLVNGTKAAAALTRDFSRGRHVHAQVVPCRVFKAQGQPVA